MGGVAGGKEIHTNRDDVSICLRPRPRLSSLLLIFAPPQILMSAISTMRPRVQSFSLGHWGNARSLIANMPPASLGPSAIEAHNIGHCFSLVPPRSRPAPLYAISEDHSKPPPSIAV